ncbi:ParA family protein [Deinococcus sp. ME38]|uniref:ParA family protein n=1 Tax=Deinococcus sp. ME38 TaxID=3400344 RepID=UPI003B5C64E1
MASLKGGVGKTTSAVHIAGRFAEPASYTHHRAPETRGNTVCRFLLGKKKKKTIRLGRMHDRDRHAALDR